MSQPAGLYSISKTTFKQLENAGNQRWFDIASAKNHATFQGTFMGLEFILSKGRDSSAVAQVEEIFNPKQSLGERESENLTHEEQFKYYENVALIRYLNMETITKLNEFLYNVSEADIA